MMTHVTVTNQTELDAALARTNIDRIEIRSDRGVWLQLISGPGVSVVARESSSVVAWESSSVVARGSSSVVARESSSVEARDSSSVEARGSVGVHGYDHATIRAAPTVAVWLHQISVTVDAGLLIDMTAIDLNDPATWAEYHGCSVVDGRIMLYKAVDAELVAGHDWRPTVYRVGTDVEATDWRDDYECGGGLHLSPMPIMAKDYFSDAKRYLRCSAVLADIRPITDGGAPKAKARAVRVEAEVDLHRREIAAVFGGAS